MLKYNSIFYKNSELKYVYDFKYFIELIFKIEPFFNLMTLNSITKEDLRTILGDESFYFNSYIRHFVWVKPFNDGVLFINYSSDAISFEYTLFDNPKKKRFAKEVFFFLYSLAKRKQKLH